MVDPLVVQGDSGTAHVMWGEPIAGMSPPYLRVGSLWYARFDGSDWTAPEQVFRASEIRWNAVFAPAAALGDDVFVAAPGFDSTRQWVGIVSLALAHGHWNATRIPILHYPNYLALAAVAPRNVLIAFPGIDDSTRGGGGSSHRVLFALQSADAGATWSRPRRLVALSEGDGYSPQAVVTSDGITHLVWSSKLFVDVAPVIRSLVTRDWQQWNSGTIINLKGPLSEFASIEGAGGRVHIVARSARTGRLASTVITRTAVMPMSTMDVPPASATLSLSRVGRDSLVLAWGIGFAAGSAGFTALATLATTCEHR